MINLSKYILGFTFALIVSAFAVTSCTKTHFEEPIVDDQTVEVSFNTAIDSSATRAWDGLNINVLYVELYFGNTKVGDRLEFDVEGCIVERFSVSLLKNQTYRAVFWAQNRDCGAYTIDSNLDEINVNYTKSVGLESTENRDAFYASVEFTVNATTQRDGVDVDLRRPFAMIAVGTATANLQPGTTTAMTISKVANKFNAKSGKASGEVAPLRLEGFTPSSAVTVPGKSEALLAIACVLPIENEQVNVTIDAQVGTKSKQTTLSIAKLEADKRYNIIGNILPANE